MQVESDFCVKPRGPVENAVTRVQRHLAENGKEAPDVSVCCQISVWGPFDDLSQLLDAAVVCVRGSSAGLEQVRRTDETSFGYAPRSRTRTVGYTHEMPLDGYLVSADMACRTGNPQLDRVPPLLRNLQRHERGTAAIGATA